MDLNLARTFVLVAEARSFTAAARSLGVPTSSASRAVGRLEAALGTRLFVRSTRKTSLTASGRVFFEHARKALAELDDGERRVGELLGQPRGELRLTVPGNLDGGYLARQLVAFAQIHPQLRLTVVPTNRKVDLEEEGFDLALRVEQKSLDSTLALHELGRFHAWLVAAPAYLARRGRPKRPQDLASHDCVGLRPEKGLSRWPLLGPRGIETVEVSGPIATDDMQLARQLVEGGAGIGTLIFAPGARALLEPGLVRVLPQYIVQGPGLHVATTSRKNLPLRVRLLREFLINAYAQSASAPPGG
jgi:DNA-binding transcriptional LysR family regulator